jgi:uncharacterized protein
MHLSTSIGSGEDLGPVNIPGILPLFPLPNVVFFPRTYLPLHIFEPRYRDMVRCAASGHRMIGMVLLKEGWEHDYEGAPQIFPIGCAGRMISIKPLPDGRFYILLQGLRRFEIQQEVGAEAFRQGRIMIKNWTPPSPELPDEVRRQLLNTVGDLLRTHEEALGFAAWLRQPLNDDALVQNLSFTLDFTPLEKQFLLESESLIQQGRRLLDLLQFKLHERNDQSGQAGRG